MRKKPNKIPDTYISDVNKIRYSGHDTAVKQAEERKQSLNSKSLKSLIKRGITETVDLVLLQSGASKRRNAKVIDGPDEQLKTSVIYLERNEEAIIIDAIHDATAAGREPNLKEPETDKHNN